MSRKTSTRNGLISGAVLAIAAVWNLTQGQIAPAVYAGLAAAWALLYAARVTELAEVESELRAIKGHAGH